MTANVQKTSRHTSKRLQYERLLFGQDSVWILSINLYAFDKNTNGQTFIEKENGENVCAFENLENL